MGGAPRPGGIETASLQQKGCTQWALGLGRVDGPPILAGRPWWCGRPEAVAWPRCFARRLDMVFLCGAWPSLFCRPNVSVVHRLFARLGGCHWHGAEGCLSAFVDDLRYCRGWLLTRPGSRPAGGEGAGKVDVPPRDLPIRFPGVDGGCVEGYNSRCVTRGERGARCVGRAGVQGAGVLMPLRTTRITDNLQR